MQTFVEAMLKQLLFVAGYLFVAHYVSMRRAAEIIAGSKRTVRRRCCTRLSVCSRLRHQPEGGMIQLETLIELKFVDSKVSSSNCSYLVVRAYYIVATRQTILCRAIRGNSISVNSIPPLLSSACGKNTLLRRTQVGI